MNTTWEQRRRIEQALTEGKAISVEDAAGLLADADQAETLDETLDALEQALQERGLALVDMTTDDTPEGEQHIALVEVH